jgi:acyl dehydratase
MSAVAGPCFQDLSVGDEIPRLHRGPLTPSQLMRWSAAMENWHRIHYDRDFAVGHDRLPGILVNGSLKQQFIIQMLKDWLGRTGWVWKVSFQFRAMNVAGDELTAWGRVTALRDAGAYGIAELELGLVDGAGRETTPGRAAVALPHRGGAPLPYPFTPPAERP